jgi:protein-disulfide isomerase
MTSNRTDMAQETSSNRIPLLIALVGAIILLGVGAYVFANKSDPIERGSVEQKTELASSVADDAVAAAGMSDKERKATEALVRSYILEHPEIITEAVEILQKREVAQRLTAAGDQLAKVFPGAEAGNPKGDVTMVEFTDYNCGFCRASVADVQRLLQSDGNIRLVYRELPILSQTSRDAALWALAAAKQGKHKAFHDAMFAGGRPDAQTIRAAASKAGMNLAAAEKFAASSEANTEIQNNLAMMQQVGFSGTPTFIIGDQILEGALGYDALKAAVEKARKQG